MKELISLFLMVLFLLIVLLLKSHINPDIFFMAVVFMVLMIIFSAIPDAWEYITERRYQKNLEKRKKSR